MWKRVRVKGIFHVTWKSDLSIIARMSHIVSSLISMRRHAEKQSMAAAISEERGLNVWDFKAFSRPIDNFSYRFEDFANREKLQNAIHEIRCTLNGMHFLNFHFWTMARVK